MSALAIHRLLRRWRRSLVLVAAVGVLATATAIEHTGMAGMHASGTAAWCLAVLPGAALLWRRRESIVWQRPWAKLITVRAPRTPLPAPPLSEPARAGPSRVAVLRL